MYIVYKGGVEGGHLACKSVRGTDFQVLFAEEFSRGFIVGGKGDFQWPNCSPGGPYNDRALSVSVDRIG